MFLLLWSFEMSRPTSSPLWSTVDRASALRGRRLAGDGERGLGAISISAESSQASAIWCTLLGEVMNFVSLAVVICHQQLLLAMPKCVGLSECIMPTILSNFRAGRHDRNFAKSAVCLKCCYWPFQTLDLYFVLQCHIWRSTQAS